MNALRHLHDYLAARNVQHALIGGRALAVRGHPRFTFDVDFLTVDTAVLKDSFWAGVREEGTSVDIRKGDFDDPLRGVVRIALADGGMVDVVIAKYRWQSEVIKRAEPVDVGDATVPVPRASDLILLKLFAGGHPDLSDVRSLLDTPERNNTAAAVREHLAELPPECAAMFDEQLRQVVQP